MLSSRNNQNWIAQNVGGRAMTHFSPNFKSFNSWLKAGDRSSRYAKRIIKLHSLEPSAALKDLRGMKITSLSPALKTFSTLTPNERDLRNRSLMVISEMRKGKNLTSAIKEHGINKRDALKHLGKFIYKKKGKWHATKTDNIERSRWIYSQGKRISITINSSSDASLISKYLNAVRRAVKSGDQTILDPYTDIKITDVYGNDYSFETDLDTIYELQDQIEDIEFLQIYNDKN